MPTRSALQRLEDIVAYGEQASQFASGLSGAELRERPQTFMATVYALQCVSEAARYLPAEIKARCDLPWIDIETASNVFRHGYHAVEADRIVFTVNETLPALLAFAYAEKDRLSGSG